MADQETFAVSEEMSGALVQLRPGGMRQLHWHTNLDEWQYVINGTIQVHSPPCVPMRCEMSRTPSQRLLSVGSWDSVSLRSSALQQCRAAAVCAITAGDTITTGSASHICARPQRAGHVSRHLCYSLRRLGSSTTQGTMRRAFCMLEMRALRPCRARTTSRMWGTPTATSCSSSTLGTLPTSMQLLWLATCLQR